MIEYNKNNLLVILGNQLFPLEYISQLNINKVSKVKNINVTKDIPIANRIKTVKAGLILIFLNE